MNIFLRTERLLQCRATEPLVSGNGKFLVSLPLPDWVASKEIQQRNSLLPLFSNSYILNYWGELHDPIGAGLSGIKFKVEKALEQVGWNEGAATESLNTIIPVIQEAVEECRRIQMDLRPWGKLSVSGRNPVKESECQCDRQ